MCPNCGNLSSRSNLIDGCDFCGTKFTIEDLDNRVASFGFRRDFLVSEGKREAIRKIIYPWFFFAGGMPFAYIGFLIPFLVVKDMEISLPAACSTLLFTSYHRIISCNCFFFSWICLYNYFNGIYCACCYAF